MSEIIRPQDFIHLRRNFLRRSITVAQLPPTIAAAYDFAAATVGCLGAKVAAWKLGATTAATRRAFATDDIYFGALLSDEVWTSAHSDDPPGPLLLRGEAEIALRLGIDIAPNENDVALASDAELFEAWAPAIEAPYSCVDNIAEVGLRALLMDRCAAGALYLGAPRADITAVGMGETLEIVTSGVCIAQGQTTALLLSPVQAARGFLAVAAAQGVHVKRGQWISTGGITPCVDLPFDQPVQLLLGGQTELNFMVKAPRK